MSKPCWVSFIIQDTKNSEPWLCASVESVKNLEEAKDVIHKQRKIYRVLSAWVDTFDENNEKVTLFHECYMAQFNKDKNPEYKQVD